MHLLYCINIYVAFTRRSSAYTIHPEFVVLNWNIEALSKTLLRIYNLCICLSSSSGFLLSLMIKTRTENVFQNQVVLNRTNRACNFKHSSAVDVVMLWVRSHSQHVWNVLLSYVVGSFTFAACLKCFTFLCCGFVHIRSMLKMFYFLMLWVCSHSQHVGNVLLSYVVGSFTFAACWKCFTFLCCGFVHIRSMLEMFYFLMLWVCSHSPHVWNVLLSYVVGLFTFAACWKCFTFLCCGFVHIRRMLEMFYFLMLWVCSHSRHVWNVLLSWTFPPVVRQFVI